MSRADMALAATGLALLPLWSAIGTMPVLPWLALHATMTVMLALLLTMPDRDGRNDRATGTEVLCWLMVCVLGPAGVAAALVLHRLAPRGGDTPPPGQDWLDGLSALWTASSAQRLIGDIRAARAYLPPSPPRDPEDPLDRERLLRRLARGAALPRGVRSPTARLALRSRALRDHDGSPESDPSAARPAGPRVPRRLEPSFPAPMPDAESDVCLIVEGCYPFRGGGVSVWLDDLMRRHPATRFTVVSIQPSQPLPPPIFTPPPNLTGLVTIRLSAAPPHPLRAAPSIAPDRLASLLSGLSGAEPRRSLAGLIAVAHDLGPDAIRMLPASLGAWRTIGLMHAADAPQTSFLQYYWAWQALYGSVIQLLAEPLPRAGIYHALSSGFAGILAARATLETRRPMLLSEHGLYANERMMEVLAASWISETIDRGRLGEDHRAGLRELWIRAFDGFARTSYAAAAQTVCLYPEAQAVQRELGADPARSSVIANGIDSSLYSGIAPAPRTAPPTIALIGRIAPIKDIETFIAAVALVREQIPALHAHVLGSDDEAPAYAARCRAHAERLGLADCLTFPGHVDVRAWLPRLHLVVLTSLSESQPFALLEAGAAGIAVVATDVGSCGGLVYGEEATADRAAGGIVVEPGDSAAIAGAITRLLRDHDLREACGQALRARVTSRYRSETANAAYAALYRRLAGKQGAD